jgi:hypothetical protein
MDQELHMNADILHQMQRQSASAQCLTSPVCEVPDNHQQEGCQYHHKKFVAFCQYHCELVCEECCDLTHHRDHNNQILLLKAAAQNFLQTID